MKNKSKLKTKQLQSVDSDALWHPFTQMSDWSSNEQIIIESGKGNLLIDTNGRSYIDGVSSLWCNVHGHKNKKLDQAVRAQLDKIAHSTLLGLGSVPSALLARKLVEVTPRALRRVFFSDSGSTAVEIALKIAVQYQQQTGNPQKRKFIAFKGAYHGDTIGAMGVGEIGAFVKKFNPLIKKAIRAPYPYCYRCPIKGAPEYPACDTACLKVFEDIIAKRHNEIAACIIEPLVQGAGGMITAPTGFLRSVRAITKKYKVLLIADEVATGFGRTGKLFACEFERVTPDLICVAKGLTGGYLPLAATIATERIFKAFLGDYSDMTAFLHGHTYTGNALASSVGLANLEIFEQEKTIEKIQPKIKLLTKLLSPISNLPHVGEVRQKGLMVGIELVADRANKARYPASLRIGDQVCRSAREHGLLIRPLGDVIVLMPPLSIKQNELKKICQAVERSIKEIT